MSYRSSFYLNSDFSSTLHELSEFGNELLRIVRFQWAGSLINIQPHSWDRHIIVLFEPTFNYVYAFVVCGFFFQNSFCNTIRLSNSLKLDPD